MLIIKLFQNHLKIEIPNAKTVTIIKYDKIESSYKQHA